VWEFEPDTRTVDVYRAGDMPPLKLTAADTLDGGDVLPGFSVPLGELFAELDALSPDEST
jgi:Uma2 family endonuclease